MSKPSQSALLSCHVDWLQLHFFELSAQQQSALLPFFQCKTTHQSDHILEIQLTMTNFLPSCTQYVAFKTYFIRLW